MQMFDGWQEIEKYVAGEDNKLKDEHVFFFFKYIVCALNRGTLGLD